MRRRNGSSYHREYARAQNSAVASQISREISTSQGFYIVLRHLHFPTRERSMSFTLLDPLTRDLRSSDVQS